MTLLDIRLIDTNSVPLDGLPAHVGNTPLLPLRRLGLDLVDSIQPLKTLFMRQASGEFGAMPRLLKGQPL